MLLLPTILFTISGISGAGGIALSLKNTIDSMDVSCKSRYIKEKHEKNVLRFEACSNKLESELQELGKQRMLISKNFSVFINAFEKIKNKPQFTKKDEEIFPEFDILEIKNSSVVANMALGGAGGAAIGSFLGAAAASGTTNLVMAIGKASTGTEIAKLTGIAKTNAALSTLGGGAKAVGGGGIALGTVVLNATTLGVAALVQGIAMAYAGSFAKKKTDEAKEQVDKNEEIINKAIEMQKIVMNSIDEILHVSAHLCNDVYKPLVYKMKELVNKNDDWNNYSDDDKLLVENNIHVVQILNYLNNISMYKVEKMNEKGEIEEISANADEVKNAIEIANKKIERIKE